MRYLKFWVARGYFVAVRYGGWSFDPAGEKTVTNNTTSN
jgi:hypothetical protein